MNDHTINSQSSIYRSMPATTFIDKIYAHYLTQQRLVDKTTISIYKLQLTLCKQAYKEIVKPDKNIILFSSCAFLNASTPHGNLPRNLQQQNNRNFCKSLRKLTFIHFITNKYRKLLDANKSNRLQCGISVLNLL